MILGELTAAGDQVVLMTSQDEYPPGVVRQLSHLTPLIRPTNPVGALQLPLTWPAVVQLAHEFGYRWRPGPRLTAWTAGEIARRAGHAPVTDWRPPTGELRPYQTAGAEMLARSGGGLITDEPGTGKTATAIAGIRMWYAAQTRARRVRPTAVVVICPASVVGAWVREWERWSPDWSAVAWRGPAQQRHALSGYYDVYVTSYDTARVDGTRLAEIVPFAVVIDECHYLKNQHAKRSTAARLIARRADMVIGLSGTPITHHPGDLWPTLTAIAPNAWPARSRWVGRYCSVSNDGYADTIDGLDPVREPEFRATLLGQHRRVAKEDVLDQLPPKVYSAREVELPPTWRTAYDTMAKKMLAELPDGGELPVMDTLVQMTRLRQLASSAADVDVHWETDSLGDKKARYTVSLKLPSWKVNALVEIAAERPDESLVVFAESRQLVLLAAQQLLSEGRRVGEIVGGQTPKTRQDVVDRFQAGELNVICATTAAGGVGLTLTAARTAVFLQRPWSLVDAIQAEDRIHRIGSEGHESIEIIDVIAVDTIDTAVREALRGKAGQLADLVQDPRIVAQLLGAHQKDGAKV